MIPSAVRPELEALAASSVAPHGLVELARIVLAAADGLSTPMVAARVGCEPRTVRKWKCCRPPKTAQIRRNPHPQP
ncbi:MAG: helix-turn-helix domain-containing protein [Deltaproteobacteria bacterium]|nr:helix-turn-helix domain-containing protein [Deltaproteobacteria bacterium]